MPPTANTLILAIFTILLVLMPAKVQPSAKHKLFMECIVKISEKGGFETLVSYSQLEGDKLVFVGLSGNIYLVDGTLAKMCEDKADEMKKADQKVLVGCKKDGVLTVKSAVGSGTRKKPTQSQKMDIPFSKVNNQCRATPASGGHDVYYCPKGQCSQKSAQLVLVKKRQKKSTVESIIYFDVDQKGMDCVKHICSNNLPQLDGVIRYGDKAHKETNIKLTGKENVDQQKENKKRHDIDNPPKNRDGDVLPKAEVAPKIGLTKPTPPEETR